MLEDAKGTKYIDLSQETELIHSGPDLMPVTDKSVAQKQDKHLVLPIEAGLYMLHQEKEYDYLTKKIEQVLD